MCSLPCEYGGKLVLCMERGKEACGEDNGAVCECEGVGCLVVDNLYVEVACTSVYQLSRLHFRQHAINVALKHRVDETATVGIEAHDEVLGVVVKLLAQRVLITLAAEHGEDIAHDGCIPYSLDITAVTSHDIAELAFDGVWCAAALLVEVVDLFRHCHRAVA